MHSLPCPCDKSFAPLLPSTLPLASLTTTAPPSPAHVTFLYTSLLPENKNKVNFKTWGITKIKVAVLIGLNDKANNNKKKNHIRESNHGRRKLRSNEISLWNCGHR